MQKRLFLSLITFFIVGLFYLYPKQPLTDPLPPFPKPKPLLVYTFDNLKKIAFPESQITVGGKLGETKDYITQSFVFSVPEKPGGKKTKKVSGVINLPSKPGNYPVIVMFRGFVPKETYQPGIGTQPSAKVMASHGFITLAPDFLGFGQSDKLSENSFEDRFQTYTTALTLLSSLSTINSGLEASYSGKIKADTEKVGIWGHSNGGHIALATLAISGGTYPTVLWSPVSKSFPYSILYYTDEFDDQGKELRSALSQFERDYDTELFSPINYYSWIKAPIQINQGTDDAEVPVWWSERLVEALEKEGIDVKYYTYKGADHNLQPAWNTAVQRTINFFDQNFAKQRI